jgi:ribonucleoside-diphosphate reductase alpha chain
VFRELAVSYLGRHDLAHVDTSDFSNTALGKGIQEGKTNLLSTGWTRGYKPTLVSGNERQASGEPKGSATAAPARASSTATVTSFAGAAARKIEPTVAISTSEIVAFKRDYEERAKELAEEIAEEVIEEVTTESQQATALFSDKAAADAASAKTEAKKIESERRARSIMQGYTGNICSECQNFTMVRNGTCEKCDTCGATSGCS